MKDKINTKAQKKQERINKKDDKRKQTKITLYFKIKGGISENFDESQKKINNTKIPPSFSNLKKKIKYKVEEIKKTERENEDIKILFEKIVSKYNNKSKNEITKNNNSLIYSNQNLENNNNNNKNVRKKEIKIEEEKCQNNQNQNLNLNLNNFQKNDELQLLTNNVKCDIDLDDSIININYVKVVLD
jgi:hypothetical protein